MSIESIPLIVNSNPQTAIPDNMAGSPFRIGPQGDEISSVLHGEFYESARVGNLFYCATQAAVATSVAMNVTNTGITVYNPVGNNKKFSVRAFAWHLTTAQVAVTLVTLGGGYLSTGAVTAHTTPAVWGTNFGSCAFGGPGVSTALCDLAATINTPRGLFHVGQAFTAGALGSSTGAYVNTGGIPILYPGAFAGIFTLTATSGQGFIIWEELPL